jgi:hypothetical protein
MGSGFRTFTAGEVLTASNVQNFLQNQSVMVFADSTARATDIGTANFEEGMLSYLENTDQLEVYNGTAWASIAPTTNQGLTLINTTSFSAVATQSFNDVFSATYTNYRIVGSFALSNSAAVLNMRLRASGSDSTAASYGSGVMFSTGSGTLNSNVVISQTSFTLTTNQGVTDRGLDLVCFEPFETIGTDLTGTISVNRFPHITSCRFSLTTSFDGFTLIPSLGDITGSVSVFGFSD